MLYHDIEVAAPLIAERLAAASHAVLITHVNPDGDAAGSLMALGRYLSNRGQRVTMVAPSALPAAALVLAEWQHIQVYTENPQLPADADLVVILDTGSIGRLGQISEREQAYLAARPVVVIDHHVTNDGPGVLNLIVPAASATCELLYDLLRCWHAEVDAEIATALLLGLLTDTQSFQTSNTTPNSLHVGGALVAAGGRLDALVNAIYFSQSFNNSRAVGMALAQLQREPGLVWTELTQEMMRAAGSDDEAADEVTIHLARIEGAQAYALFKEREDGTVKISLRSRPGVDVSLVARGFGGGGHVQASGAVLNMGLPEAKVQVLAALREAIHKG